MLLSSLYDLKNRNLKKLFNQLLWRKKGKEFSPYRNFKDIIKLEEKYNAKSSFYFIATDNDIKRFRYDIEDLENDLFFIIDKGWEVGLHCGYFSYDNLNLINKEKKRLEKLIGKEVIGCRNHYLRFKVPDTWELLAKAGFKYDSTFGYSDVVGFRNGMCHPFKPINLKTHREIDILEIPLNVMDSTILKYMGSTDAWKTAKKLIDTTEKYNGVITLLWHNDVLNCSFREKWRKLYEKILLYCYEKNAWMTSGEEVYIWWKKNGL
jgi:peptidoglycan/xylan/chitin deacetylase (PgdA/CDA1 family)